MKLLLHLWLQRLLLITRKSGIDGLSFSLEKSMALDIDSLDSTRAIEYPVISPSDADGMFDLITMKKVVQY